jgi:hypothetical protein
MQGGSSVGLDMISALLRIAKAEREKGGESKKYGDRIEEFVKLIKEYGLESALYSSGAVIVPFDATMHEMSAALEPGQDEAKVTKLLDEYSERLNSYIAKVFTADPPQWTSRSRKESADVTAMKQKSKNDEYKIEKGADATSFKVTTSGIVSGYTYNIKLLETIHRYRRGNSQVSGSLAVFILTDESGGTGKGKKGGGGDGCNHISGGLAIRNLHGIRQALHMLCRHSEEDMIVAATSLVNGFYVAAHKYNSGDLDTLRAMKMCMPELSAMLILAYCQHTKHGQALYKQWNGTSIDFKLAEIWAHDEFEYGDGALLAPFAKLCGKEGDGEAFQQSFKCLCSEAYKMRVKDISDDSTRCQYLTFITGMCNYIFKCDAPTLCCDKGAKDFECVYEDQAELRITDNAEDRTLVEAALKLERKK